MNGYVNASTGLDRGFDEQKVRSPAREHGRWFQAATVVGLLLLLDAGLITTGILL